MADDIEQFIKEQKARLAKERDNLTIASPRGEPQITNEAPRKKWNKDHPDEFSMAVENKAPNPENGANNSGAPLQPTWYDQQKKQLQEERRKEYNDMIQKQNARNAPQQRGSSPEHLGLPVGGYDLRRKKLEEERHREYNQLLAKKAPRADSTKPAQTPEHKGLPVADDVERRRRLEEERKQEYNALLAKQNPRGKSVKPPPSPEHIGLPVGDNSKRRQQLEEERKQEYNALLSQQPLRTRNPHVEPLQNVASPVLGFEEERRKLEEQRNAEYKALMEQRNGYVQPLYKENIPPKPDTPETGLIGKMGSYEDKRRKLQEERKKEYNRLLAIQNVRTTGQTNGVEDDYVKSLPGMRDRSEEQVQKHKERNDEYNDFIRKKQGVSFQDVGQQMASPVGPPQPQARQGDEYYATLPVRDHPSAEAEKIRTRNKEYNEVLRIQNERKLKERTELEERMHQPRKGWATPPTYEEILDQKRREERGYRRYDDDPDVGMRLGGSNYLRASRSDGFLNASLEEESRLRALDQEYEARKQRYLQEQKAQSVLEDSNWLRYETGAGRLGKTGGNSYGSVPDLPLDLNEPPPRQRTFHGEGAGAPLSLRERDRVKSAPRFRGSEREQPYTSATGLQIGGKEIGREVTQSADQRRKEAYRQDLLRQMEEINNLKRRERQAESRVNLTGAVDPEKRPDRIRDLPPPPGGAPPDRVPVTSQDLYRNKDFSPRDIVYGDLNRNKPTSSTGILERGFEGLFQPSTLNSAASPLRTYDRAGAAPRVGGAIGNHTPADEAYHYFGMKNLLDPNTAQELPSGHAGLAPIPAADPAFNSLSSAVPSSIGIPKQVTFDERSLSRNTKPDSTTGGMPFPLRENEKDRSKQMQYQQELQKQIEEAKQKKQKEKEEKERYDRKLEEEIRNYDPFGRGGGGAPMKDNLGNVVADLRQMRNTNEETLLSPRRRPAQELTGPTMVGLYDPPSVPKAANTFLSPRSNDGTFARGGHGIFGEPKTDAQKTASDRYKEELQKQIDEKKRKQEEEKEKERQREQLEEKRLEEERVRLAHEYEEEQRQKREKEEELNRQNEELKRQAEERKQEAERRRQAAEEERMREKRKEQEEEERRKRLQDDSKRGNSPPLPAVRSKTESLVPKDSGRRSPPVPAVSTQQRAGSADVLNQLARMRQQLQSERRRVENALDHQEDDVEVFDPRIQHKPPPTSRRKPTEVDVFEVARNKEPVSVRRPSAEPVNTRNASADPVNPRNVDDFNSLKNKSNSDSRQALREMFPGTPTNADALDLQQTVLLRQQEENLKALENNKKKKSRFEDAFPNMNPRDLGLIRENTLGSQTPLQSDSAFIGFDADDLLSPDNRDKTRNDSARSRRRNRYDSATPPVTGRNRAGSTTSIDPDKITKRNEERLRKLQNLGGDEVSTGDPDDILERFMARQQHDRPPSRATLNDDSWLNPSSKTGR